MFYWFVQIILWYLRAVEEIGRATQQFARGATEGVLNAWVLLIFGCVGVVLLGTVFVLLFVAAGTVLERLLARLR
jgi:hypothetical protein